MKNNCNRSEGVVFVTDKNGQLFKKKNLVCRVMPMKDALINDIAQVAVGYTSNTNIHFQQIVQKANKVVDIRNLFVKMVWKAFLYKNCLVLVLQW